MKFNPDIHHRRSMRLKGRDYSKKGAYFLTICTQNRECLFGNIISGQMELNNFGKILNQSWLKLDDRFPNIATDAFVIMPNHFHGIIFIHDPVGAGVFPPLIGCNLVPPTIVGNLEPNRHTTGTHLRAGGSPPLQRYKLGHMVAHFKYQTTKFIISENKSIPSRIWQRNYHEHIIRNEDEINRIREYILQNPLKWEIDLENPNAVILETKNPWEISENST